MGRKPSFQEDGRMRNVAAAMTAPGNTIFRSRVPLGTLKVGTMASLQTFKCSCPIGALSSIVRACFNPAHMKKTLGCLYLARPRGISIAAARGDPEVKPGNSSTIKTQQLSKTCGFLGKYVSSVRIQNAWIFTFPFSSATVVLYRRVSSSDATIRSNRTSAKISDLKKHAQR
jgi:hypothetical protein